MIWVEKGFLLYVGRFFFINYSFVSADSCGICEEGKHSESEGRFPSSRSSPPATENGLLPASRAKRLLRIGAAGSHLRRAFAEGEQPRQSAFGD